MDQSKADSEEMSKFTEAVQQLLESRGKYKKQNKELQAELSLLKDEVLILKKTDLYSNSNNIGGEKNFSDKTEQVISNGKASSRIDVVGQALPIAKEELFRSGIFDDPGLIEEEGENAMTEICDINAI